jgi:beta-glucosidase
MQRVVLCIVALLAFASCDRSSVRHFLHRLKTKPRTQMDSVTPVMKDQDRHQQFLDRIKQGEIDVLFLGDSITDYWPRDGQESWVRFADYKPANFGVSGDRTEHLLWRINNGELDGIDPKVVVLLIGTNNIGNFEDERPDWIAAGINQVVSTVREHLPHAKVILLGIFPRDGKESPQRKAVGEVNAQLRTLNDGDKVHFLDIGEGFLDAEGNIQSDLMPDQLHLSAKGYEMWFEKTEPLLRELWPGKIDKD